MAVDVQPQPLVSIAFEGVGMFCAGGYATVGRLDCWRGLVPGWFVFWEFGGHGVLVPSAAVAGCEVNIDLASLLLVRNCAVEAISIIPDDVNDVPPSDEHE